MPPTTETELKELRDLVIGLREEIRVGFAKVDTKFAEVNGEIQRIEAKTDTKLAEVQGQINVLEERTRLYWPCGDYCCTNNSFSAVFQTCLGSLVGGCQPPRLQRRRAR
jgi:hypothetical protein